MLSSQGCGFGAVEKPIRRQYKKMCTASAQKSWRGMRLFLCFQPDVFVRWSHIPLSYVGVPSVIQQGAMRPKTGGVIFTYDFSNTPTAIFQKWRCFYAKNNLGFFIVFGGDAVARRNVTGVWNRGTMFC